MHPNELKNRALVAASEAQVDGFFATAEALLNIAMLCSREATTLYRTNQHLHLRTQPEHA